MYEIPTQYRPSNPYDLARWEQQGLRYRLLTGQHRDDVIAEIRAMFGQNISADLSSHPDLSRNSFRMIWQQLSTAYIEQPTVTLDGYEGDLSAILTSKLWPIRATLDLWALSIRESLIRIDWSTERGQITYRPVSPDTIRAMRAMPGQPDEPGMLEEIRPRETADGQMVWTIETWDVRDPSAPVFKIETINRQNQRQDVTEQFSPELVGQYPYIINGVAVLPYILIHAEVGHKLWGHHEGSEIEAGALRLMGLMSHWCEGYQSSAYPQRYAVDITTQAGITRNYAGHQIEVIPTDHKSILKFKSDGPGGGQIGQYSPAMEPASAAEALTHYEKGLAIFAGLNPSDLQVTQGQSGYAIVVSRDGMRRQQQRLEPARLEADQKLMALAAKMANAYASPSPGLPEDPESYQIEYGSIGESAQEQKVKLEAIKMQMELGLMSRVDAYREIHPQCESDEDAVSKLIDIDKLSQILRAGSPDDMAPDDMVPDDMAPEIEEAPPAALPADVDKAADTALNGAQVQAAMGIVVAVSEGTLPRDAAMGMLAEFFNLGSAQAAAIMGSVGKGFEPPPLPALSTPQE